MKLRLSTLGFLLLLVGSGTRAWAGGNPEPQVVPAVQKWVGGEGTITLGKNVVIQVDAKDQAALDSVAHLLQTDLATLSLGNASIEAAAAAGPGKIFLHLGAVDAKTPHAHEAYAMTITDGVDISAATPAGVFYGTRTVLQLLEQNRDGQLPRGTIIDYPNYARRMLMLDVGRKPFPLDVLKDYLRLLSWYKMNELHLHLSDEAFGGSYTGFRVECQTFPGLTSKDCFYTKAQLRELQDMAKTMGITITPEIDMPGHAQVFTNYWPDLRLKGHASYLDVTNPATITRLEKLLDEMIPVFDAPDFHIGTDEYSVGGTKEERDKLHEAFRQFINTMNAHIRSKGKNCRIWSGYDHMPGPTQIDPTVIIDMWETDDARHLIEQGHKVINSDQGRTYIVPGAKYYGVSNAGVYNGWEPWHVSGDMNKNPKADDPNLLGAKLHVWNDQGPTGYTMTEIADLAFPSIQAFSEKLWGRKGSAEYRAFQGRAALAAHVPGVTVFDRIAPASADGLVLKVDGEQTLGTVNTSIPLPFAAKDRQNLEYPWTLTMEVCKTAETGKRGVILSSDLAEICSDYSQSQQVKSKDANGKEVNSKVTHRGIGVVRAAGAPGADPASSYVAHDDSRVYGEALPLNKWTTLTIVGTRHRTSLYVNGVAAGEQGEQTLCPLALLGGKTGQSFVGKIRHLQVYDHALTPKDIGRAAGMDIPENLAAHCTATAFRSDTDHGFVPEQVVDEDDGTRWSSGPTGEPGWVAVDLGKEREFNSVRLNFEAAYARQVGIEVSENGTAWRPIAQAEGHAGMVAISFAPVRARHVRVSLKAPGTGWGYSLWDFQVLGSAAQNK
jgi:hexosaminidase